MIYKLFRVKSEMNSVPFDNGWWDNVEINWIVIERDRPVISYMNAILDYNKLDSFLKMKAEKKFNEYFTEEEALGLNELLVSLELKNNPIELEEFILPLSASRLISENESSSNRKGTSVFHIHAFEGYNLPFKVIGVADYSTAIPRHTAAANNTEQ